MRILLALTRPIYAIVDWNGRYDRHVGRAFVLSVCVSDAAGW